MCTVGRLVENMYSHVYYGQLVVNMSSHVYCKQAGCIHVLAFVLWAGWL
jgi:hypothetical protein